MNTLDEHPMVVGSSEVQCHLRQVSTISTGCLEERVAHSGDSETAKMIDGASWYVSSVPSFNVVSAFPIV